MGVIPLSRAGNSSLDARPVSAQHAEGESPIRFFVILHNYVVFSTLSEYTSPLDVRAMETFLILRSDWDLVISTPPPY